MAGSAEIVVERRGQLGLVTLNRPSAINALTHDMVVALRGVLDEWADDGTVQTVALTGAGDRGLCAGGDVVTLHALVQANDFGLIAEFWRAEYALNALIANYPKPFVAIMDGLVLGGGIGVSAHGSHRVVTERSKVGMPETAIGFVPDVGGTWLLSHTPGELGTYLALTASTVGAADAIFLGLADAFVPAAGIPSLLRGLESMDAAAALAAAATEPPPSQLAAEQHWIDDACAGDSVSAIALHLNGLAERGNIYADAARTALATKSPLALAVTLASLRRARQAADLGAALASEFRVSLRVVRSADFSEGVRAQMIDKDRNPRWQPASHAEVTPETVEAFFAPFGVAEPDEFVVAAR